MRELTQYQLVFFKLRENDQKIINNQFVYLRIQKCNPSCSYNHSFFDEKSHINCKYKQADLA